MNWQTLFDSSGAADWILLTAFHSLWLSLAASLIIRVRRLRAPAVRSTWCTCTLILLLILPLITLFTPRPVVRAQTDHKVSLTTRTAIVDIKAPLLNNLLGMKTPVPPARLNHWKPVVNQFGCLWLAVTLACVGRLLCGLAFLKGYCDCLREVLDDRLTAILQEINESFDFRLRPRFFVSLTLPSPVSLGIRKPVVILPAALYQSIGNGELRAILLHELAHIHHSDHVLGLLQRLVKALYWWNPFVYHVCNTLTTAREEVSDNYAISAMGSAVSYATLLVGIIEKAPLINRMPCVAGMATPYQCLETRIWNIVSKRRDLRVKAGKGMISAIAGTAVLMCGLVAIGSQVKVFGAGQASISGNSKPIGADTKNRRAEFDSRVLPVARPVSKAPDNSRSPSSPAPMEGGQRTDVAAAPTLQQGAVTYISMARSGASFFAFPTLRNEEADAPQTTPIVLDESNPPVILSRAEAELTPAAKRARISATVTVAVVVNEKGEVYEARVKKGHPLLNQPALNAVLQWKFEPILVDGAPRAFATTVDFHF